MNATSKSTKKSVIAWALGDDHSVRLDLFLFLTSCQKSLNGILRILTDSKYLASSTMFVFFGQSEYKDSALTSD